MLVSLHIYNINLYRSSSQYSWQFLANDMGSELQKNSNAYEIHGTQTCKTWHIFIVELLLRSDITLMISCYSFKLFCLSVSVSSLWRSWLHDYLSKKNHKSSLQRISFFPSTESSKFNLRGWVNEQSRHLEKLFRHVASINAKLVANNGP